LAKYQDECFTGRGIIGGDCFNYWNVFKLAIMFAEGKDMTNLVGSFNDMEVQGN
jgi:hypothetical protein